MKRVVLIGIDGLDMDILHNWFEPGDLPNIYGLVQKGASAGLRSVRPLNSAAAWTSMLTGRHPAGHGVFGFTRTHPDGYRRSPVNSGDIGAAALWHIANRAGAKVGLVNFPMTYPPPELDGFAISGIPVPYNQLWAYPPDTQDELRDLFGQYLVDLPWWDLADGTPGRYEKFIADMYRMARKREEVALWTMRNRPWRIFAVVFTGTDRILHSFWHFSDAGHHSHNPDMAAVHGREIKRYLVLLDEIIGRIRDVAGGDTPVVMASDHGFGPLSYRFNIRRWLENKGYLATLPEGASNPNDESLDEPLRNIDWERTAAYPASISEAGIWINKKGRQSRGTVTESEYEKIRGKISTELSESRPDGHKAVKSVLGREEIPVGIYRDEAPDLLIEAGDGYIIDDCQSEEEIVWSERETATHRLTGIFSACGEGFREGTNLGELSITDVLPTLLAAAGIEAPENLDGSVCVDAFENPPQVKISGAAGPPKRRELPESDKDEQAVKNQLKGLGYL